MYKNKKFGLSQNQIISILRRIPLFEGLSDREYVILTDFCHVTAVNEGNYLFHEGEFGYELYVLLAGEMSIYNKARGKLGSMKPGDVLGEMAVVRKSSRSADAVAERDSLLLRIKRIELDQLVGKAPRISYIIVLNIARLVSERLLVANNINEDPEQEEHWDYEPISVR
ncbi:cyclic nucleotide-binding domain-containing protein [Ectothiorhodospiraceae bacterium BW-2]|nr:cyclic nucleotide-binding domain-containing protein [Ectothiorhodospiraceae bacterium BW-2]